MKYLSGRLKELFVDGEGGATAAAVLLFSAVLSAYAVLFVSPGVFDPVYSIYLDVSSFYWIQKLWDLSLFPSDPLAGIYAEHLFQPWPESLWVWVTALFMKTSPYTVGLKALTVLSCGAAALLLRRLALASPARAAAGIAPLLFVTLFLSMDTFYGAPRVYGLLLLLCFAAAAEERRFLFLPAITVLSLAVYPAAAAGLGLSAAAVPLFFREELRSRRLLPRYLAALLLAGAACLLLLRFSALVAHASPEGLGSEYFEAGKFYQMAASRLDAFNPVDMVANFILNLNEHGRLYIIFLPLAALLYGLGLMVRPGRPAMLPRSLPLLLAGCGSAFLALYPMHPVSASRQMVFLVPLFAVFLAAEGLYVWFGDRLRAAGVAAVCAALFAALHPVYGEVISMRGYSGAYSFLAGTPKDAVIAGYPESFLTASVPVFSARRSLVSADTTDQELLFITTPGEYFSRRLLAIRALYCVPGAAEKLVSDYGVGWLLAEEKYYSEEFLSRAAASAVPADREAAESLVHGPGAAACYSRHRGSAAYAWPGGAIVQVKAGGRR